jgi:hypothetical protein
MLISSPVFATKLDAPDKVVMNIFELGVRPIGTKILQT